MDPLYQEDTERPGRSGIRAPLAIGLVLLVALGGVAGWLHLNQRDVPPAQVAGIPLAAPPGAGVPLRPGPVQQAPLQPAAPDPAPGPLAIPEALTDAEVEPASAVVGALAPAPDPALVEPGPHGPLPRVGADGRQPWHAYGRPAPAAGDAPRLAVVVGRLGLDRGATEQAIQRLPPEITLAFSPYAFELQAWIDTARAAGHEVLLQVPMEPEDFPANDPGPGTLLLAAEARENEGRLLWLLSQATGYAGIASHRGERFTLSGEALHPVLHVLRERGMMIFDSRSALDSRIPEVARSLALPAVAAEIDLDTEPDPDVIGARLQELEGLALEFGSAAATANPYPVTLDRLAAWAAGLSARGIVLVPVTALAQPGAASVAR